MTEFEFLFTPFIACLLLALVNVYFGIHVIKREIIFIDIALAQIAALGSALAMVIFHASHPDAAHEHDTHNAFTYLFSLGFIVAAAIVFTLLKNKKITIPLEALIGIAYALATTGTVIILDKGAGGDVHVHDMLVGSILWVSWHQITRLFAAILVVGIIHFVFRKKFLNLSDTYFENGNVIKNKILWDFLFYLSFGIVVIEAVNVAGILTVFAFLIIPASLSSIFVKNWWTKIWFGWTLSIIISIIGLYASWKMDVPCSPVIIVLLGAALVLSLLLKYLLIIKTKYNGKLNKL
ncbi:metal ABC transporter permease [Bacteroidota bacterium]